MSGQNNRPDNDPVPENNVLLGRIGAAHGIRGEVRIQSFTQNPVDLAKYSPLKTDRPGLTISILSARKSKNVIIARLEGVTERSQVEKLNGVKLFVAREQLPNEDDEDSFYQFDLIGLEARLADGTVLGKVIAVPNFGADDLIEVGTNAKTELYQFSKAVVPEVNISGGYIIIAPPDEIIVRDEQ